MLIGGLTWTFVLGSAASVFTTVSSEQNIFNANLDQLNKMFNEKSIQDDLRQRIRGFYHQASRQLSKKIHVHVVKLKFCMFLTVLPC